jgi:bifunctional non-homologous end joining protein LigD
MNRRIAHSVKPMLATFVSQAFDNEDWIFELKLDGFRAIAEVRNKKLLLYSRSGISIKQKYPAIAAALRKLTHEVILDGEIVLLNNNQRPDFQALQHYSPANGGNIVYYVFDLLWLDGKDIKVLPLIARKKLLKKSLRKNKAIKYCDHIEKYGKDFFKTVKMDDMEGIMAKKKDSLYHPGTRTKEWLKIKHQKSQDAIIVGYTEPNGARLHFGSLLLAQYRNKKLIYIGQVGTGFGVKLQEEILSRLKKVYTNRSPFDQRIRSIQRVQWVKPELVCEVGYTEITRDGLLRHPVFKGLRTDKKSYTIRKENDIPIDRILSGFKHLHAVKK